MDILSGSRVPFSLFGDGSSVIVSISSFLNKPDNLYVANRFGFEGQCPDVRSMPLKIFKKDGI